MDGEQIPTPWNFLLWGGRVESPPPTGSERQRGHEVAGLLLPGDQHLSSALSPVQSTKIKKAGRERVTKDSNLRRVSTYLAALLLSFISNSVTKANHYLPTSLLE